MNDLPHPVAGTDGVEPGSTKPCTSTCLPGHLRVDLAYSERSGHIEIGFYIYEAVTITTGCYEEDGIGDPDVLVGPDAMLRVWASSSSGSFFREMICWLEAIATGVRECAFIWDGEGPDGELRWHRDFKGSGHLEIKWSGGCGSAAFQHEAKLNRHQLVAAMYGAFVAWIQSDAYDPILFESMTDGEAYSLLVKEGLLPFAEEIARRDRSSAFQLIRVVWNCSRDYDMGPRRGEDLATFIRMADSKPPFDLTDEIERDHIQFLIDSAWDQWSFDERLAYVHEVVFGFRSDGLTGDRLRELRSQRIEAWLLDTPTS